MFKSSATLLICLVLGFYHSAVFADIEKYRVHCKKEPPATTKSVFPGGFDQAKKIRAQVCQNIGANIFTKESLQNFLPILDALGLVFPSTGLHQQIRKRENDRILNETQIAKLEVFDEANPISLVVEGKIIPLSAGSLNECKQFANDNSIDDCASVLRIYASLYNYAQESYAKKIVVAAKEEIKKVDAEWDEYFAKSRSQTLFEMGINGKRFQKDNTDYGFASPPNSQLILLHPGIVIENIEDAVDGEQAKEALIIEVFGVNYWKRSGWNPTGYSAGLLFSDRADQRDYAFAVSVHFNNTLTFGASFRHNGTDDIGYFISYDLLKGLQDRKETYKKYREELQQ